jgi:phage terminase large subunit GpA-like protein
MQFSSGMPMVSSKRRRLYDRAGLLLTLTPRTTPDRWALYNRRYAASSGKPGARDATLTPYCIPWARAVAAGGGKYRRAVLITAAQSGKTDSMLDVIGSRLDTRPVPIIYCGPSLDFVSHQFEPRLMELFDQAPTLRGKIARGQKNKKTRKTVAGVQLRLAHAGSSTALKSSSAGLALVDELDAMLVDVGHQGDPLSLVTARGDTFADFMVGVASTPSIGVGDVETDPVSGLEFWKVAPPEDLQSPIWRLFQTGTRHHWAWCCPHCLDYFIPRFTHLKWQSGEGEHLTTPAQAKRSAYVECPRCGGVLTDHDKLGLNASGVFVSPGQLVAADGEVVGEPPDSSTLSFWVSGLASPFVTFGQRAETFLDAVREASAEKIQVATNAGFGELFSIGGGDAPSWNEVSECRSEYKLGEIPKGVRVLIASCDIQKDKIYYVIRGWGERAASWLIDCGTLHGETIEQEIWTDLADLIQTSVCGAPLRLVLVDGGYRPGKVEEMPLNMVYDFARQFPRLVRVTKGASTVMRTPLVASSIEVTTRHGAPAKAGLKQLRLDTDYFKSWLFERIRRPQGQPGAWHLPHDATEDYMRQVVSEARVRLASGRIKWVRRSRQNHFLDCESMNAAGAHLLNVARIGPTRVAALPPPLDAPETGTAPPPQPAPLRPGQQYYPDGTPFYPPPNQARPTSWVRRSRFDRWDNDGY